MEAPGYKYNLTTVAAALGIHQLARAEAMRQERAAIAAYYREAFEDLYALELPPDVSDRIHTWHLFPLRLRLDILKISRNEFIELLKAQGVGCSVHWRSLHLHPYYQQNFGWRPQDCPVATTVWERLISLPLFPGMTKEEQEHVVETVRRLV
jgi:perosamine synthetase